MKIINRFKRFINKKPYYHSVFLQQASYIQQAARALEDMMETTDYNEWKSLEREIKICEVQGDALLTEFHEQLFSNLVSPIKKSDIHSIAMQLDDFLDSINGCAKAILLYNPKKIDVQLKDMAQFIQAEAAATRSILEHLSDFKNRPQPIIQQCDRITELEHAADDSYAEYIGLIFNNEKDAIELMKYKNIAESLEASTDVAKCISDNIRKLVLRYIS